jgi:hypothetical protein
MATGKQTEEETMRQASVRGHSGLIEKYYISD